jgi:hypothetical protein
VLYSVKGAKKLLNMLKNYEFYSRETKNAIDDVTAEASARGDLNIYGKRVFVQDPKFGSFLEGSPRYKHDAQVVKSDPACIEHNAYKRAYPLLIIVLCSLLAAWKLPKYRKTSLALVGISLLIYLVIYVRSMYFE